MNYDVHKSEMAISSLKEKSIGTAPVQTKARGKYRPVVTDTKKYVMH